MNKYVRLVLNLVIYFGVYMAVSLGNNLVVIPQFPAVNEYLWHNIPIWITVNFAISSVILLFVVRMKNAVRARRGEVKRESIVTMSRFTNLSRENWVVLTILGLAIGIFYLSILKISYIASAFPGFEAYVTLFMQSDSFLLILLGLVVIGPIFEEVLFRGVILNTMRQALPFWVALLLQAVLYAYAQPNEAVQLIAFFLALIYGVVYARLQSVWSTIWISAVMNAFIFTSKQFGLHELFASFSDSTLFFSAFISLFLMAYAVYVITRGSHIARYNVMVGNLVLWVFLYFAIYLPALLYWNNTLLNMSSLAPFLKENNVLGFVFYDIIALAVYYVVMRLLHKEDLIKVSNFSRIPVKAGVMIGALGVAMGIWVQCFFKIPYMAKQFPQFEQLFTYLTTATFVILIVFLVIHSIYKEVFFRAMIYNVLRREMNMPLSILMCGVVYGGLFFNWDIPMTVYALAGALIFSAMFEWYRSIWAPIINEFVLFFTYYWFRKINLSYGPLMLTLIVVSSIAIVAIMIYLFRHRETKESREQDAHSQTAERKPGVPVSIELGG